MEQECEPIDVVLTWVDGADPNWRRKKAQCVGAGADVNMDDVAGETRYSALGELRWALCSINRFMPWVRKIFIVTDNQAPLADMDFTQSYFPDHIPMEVVDHRIIFRGMEDILPVFNSRSIETALWRIPGLSRRYIYFNDDMFALAPMKPTDWFAGDQLICHGYRMPLFWAKMLEKLRRKGGRHAMGFKTAIVNAASIMGSNHIVCYYHTPLAQDRMLLEEFFHNHPGLLRSNANSKFRAPFQFSTHSLCNLLAEKEGRLQLIGKDNNLFLKPEADRPGYLERKFAKANGNGELMVGCVESLDKASEQQRIEFEQWISNRLQLG